jgi:hypothetical protein
MIDRWLYLNLLEAIKEDYIYIITKNMNNIINIRRHKKLIIIFKLIFSISIIIIFKRKNNIVI